MSRPCSICAHPARKAIDKALASGESLRDIAGRTGTTKSALDRHGPHVSAAIVAVIEKCEERGALDIVANLERVTLEAWKTYDEIKAGAEGFGPPSAYLKEVRATAEFLGNAKLQAEQDRRPLAERVAEAKALAAEILLLTEGEKE